MPRKLLSTVMAITALLLTTGIALAFEFSADMVMTAEGRRITGKIYGKGEKARMEMTAEGHRMISITRSDKKLVWNLMPDQKMYMEMPFNPKETPKTEIKGEIDRKLVGNETIDGHPTQKYLVTYKEGASTEKVYQWMATDINFPVKTADLNTKWVQEFHNIKLEPQADSLFEEPAGFQKMKMPNMR